VKINEGSSKSLKREKREKKGTNEKINGRR